MSTRKEKMWDDYDETAPLPTREKMFDCPDIEACTGMTDSEAREALEGRAYCEEPATRWLGYVRELRQILHIFRLVARWLEWQDPILFHRVLPDRYTSAYDLLSIFKTSFRTSYLCRMETGSLILLALEDLLKHAEHMEGSRIPLQLLDPPPTGSSICLFHMPQTCEESAILDLIVRDANAGYAADLFLVDILGADIFGVDSEHKLFRITKRRRDTKAN